MMKWSKEEEDIAKEEYLLMMDALRNSDEFGSEWKGKWDSYETETFAGKKIKVKGDRDKYMSYWIENQKVINDSNWNDFSNNNNDEDYYNNNEYI
ncbi:MAG: hypothetical protein LBM02_09855 [Lachnospiraceae bacterium]|jgi:hypothetical protein|nr:hypothetical protein [Lachnospiraceae bacterium]